MKNRGVTFSVFAPRKIPFLFKMFEKTGGDLVQAKEKNYSKVGSFIHSFVLHIIIIITIIIIRVRVESGMFSLMFNTFPQQN